MSIIIISSSHTFKLCHPLGNSQKYISDKDLMFHRKQLNSFLFVVPVVRMISISSIDRSLRDVAQTSSVVVTSIVSSIVSLVGIEPVAGIEVVSVSSSKRGETKSEMFGLKVKNEMSRLK